MTSVVSLVMSPVTTCIATLPILVSCIVELEVTLEKGPNKNDSVTALLQTKPYHTIKFIL